MLGSLTPAMVAATPGTGSRLPDPCPSPHFSWEALLSGTDTLGCLEQNSCLKYITVNSKRVQYWMGLGKELKGWGWLGKKKMIVKEEKSLSKRIFVHYLLHDSIIRTKWKLHASYNAFLLLQSRIFSQNPGFYCKSRRYPYRENWIFYEDMSKKWKFNKTKI